jgi:hypothetical protein
VERIVSEGMHVYSSDGARLGKVMRVGDATFDVEKGLFFPKDYLVRFAEVDHIDGDRIHLSIEKAVLEGERDLAYPPARGEVTPTEVPIAGPGPTTLRESDKPLVELVETKHVRVEEIEDERPPIRRDVGDTHANMTGIDDEPKR